MECRRWMLPGSRYIRRFMSNKKVILTVVYTVLLILLYVVIFTLSAQDGDTSGELSMKLSEKCSGLLGNFSGKGRSDALERELAAIMERPLRKTAHFTEYACMGALVYLLGSLWMKKRRLLYVIPPVWVFVSAVLDEFHQSFVPGRYAGFSDVCVDLLGGVAGLIFLLLLQKFFGKKNTHLRV